MLDLVGQLAFEFDEEAVRIKAEHSADPYRYRLAPEKAFQHRAHVWLSPGWVTFAAQEMEDYG